MHTLDQIDKELYLVCLLVIPQEKLLLNHLAGTPRFCFQQRLSRRDDFAWVMHVK